MTDFNRIKQNIPRTTAYHTVSETAERSYRRPLMLPVLLLFASCRLTYALVSWKILIAATLIIAVTGVFFLIKREITYFIGLVLTLILIIICCTRMLSVLNAKLPSEIYGGYTGIVVSSDIRLSGTRKITARFGDVNAELRADDGLDLSYLEPGVCFKASGKFKEPAPPGNPGEFDYPLYLKSKGIMYLFYADSITITSEPSKAVKALLSFPEICFRVRKEIFERFTYGRCKEEKAMFAAVCLGDTSLCDESLTRDFKISGCSHLLAVSGTHFAGFLVVLPYILGVLSPDRKKTSFVYVLFAFITACITGWSESVTRAAVMSSCSFSGKDSISAIAVSSIVMIAADPFCVSRTGFLLSFSACIAIKLLSGRIRDLLKFIKEKKGIVMALSAQIAALMGTMPFSGLTQNRSGPVQFIVQAVGSLLAKSACVMFVPGVILSLILPQNASFAVSAPANLILVVLKNSVKAGADYSMSAAGKPVDPVILISLWLFFFAMLMPRFAIRKVLIRLSCCLLAVSTGITASGIVRPLKAEIVFADVGQGDCCLIIAGDHTCLIDSGTYEKGDSAVSDLLDHYGIGSVDIAFMTHWDMDHAGGIAALQKKGRIGRIYTGFTGYDEDTDAFERSVRLKKCDPEEIRRSIEQTKAGDVFELSDNVRLIVICPENCSTGGNPGSLVIELECCGTKLLFTGDIGLETEAELVSNNLINDIEILKVSHHGSRYASSKDFLERSSPEICVISVGRNNLYGHPASATVGRLEAAGSKIYRTDRDGAVIFEFY